MRSISIGLLGFGTVGSGIVKMVREHQNEIREQVDAGVSIQKILVQDLDKTRPIQLEHEQLVSDPLEILHDPAIEIVIEVVGGIEPAKTYIMEALRQKKHVITANKDLMAIYGSEIIELAKENQCDVFYEASVAGGIPIIRTLTEGFSSDRLFKIMGIVNGTTNYILCKMSQEGLTYHEALKQAQEKGYAESNPAADVEGQDAARKMAILSSLGFHMQISLEDVQVQGITHITPYDISYANRLGYELKLLGIADCQDGKVNISVEPTMIKKSHPLASINDVFNAVFVHGKAVGETMFMGAGAGDLPTATSIVADLVATIKNMRLGVTGKKFTTLYRPKQLMAAEEVEFQRFFLFLVQDLIGVLAHVTKIFAECNISLASLYQKHSDDTHEAEITVITHKASKEKFEHALEKFESVAAIRKIKSMYRVENF